MRSSCPSVPLLACVRYSTVVNGSLHGRFISFHLLDLYLVRFHSFPAFSLIFHHFDIKNLHDEKYLCLFLGSGVAGLGVCGPGSWGLGSWGLGVQRIEHALF